MGVYRCPNSSDDLLPSPIHKTPFPPETGLGKRLSRPTVTSSSCTGSGSLPPSPRARKSRKDDVTKRRRSGMDANKKQQIEMAKKKDQHRSQLRKRDAGHPFVFVGNVKSTVSEKELRDTFEQCGPVHRIIIRCSKGAAVNVGGHFPGRLSTDRQYATVEYKNPSSAAQALQLDGCSLQGVRVVVCSNPQGLPEVHQRPMSQSRQNRFPVIPFLKRKRINGAVTGYPTELAIEDGEDIRREPRLVKPTHKNRVWGITFPKTVM